MKTSALAISLFTTTLITFVPPPSQGAILLSDSFSYADGALDQAGTGWNIYSGLGGQTISSGRLLIDDNGTGDFNRALSAAQTAGTIYAGFTFTVSSDPPSSGLTDGYFAGFYVSGSTLRNRLVVYRPTGSTDGMFTLAVSSDGGAFVNWATELAQNTSYRIVTSFDFATKTSTLWVNALAESDTSVAQVGTASTASLPAFAFRINSTSDGDKQIDDLIVATSFAEALSPVPEPAHYGLCCALALLGLSGAQALIRRRSCARPGAKA